MSDYYFIFNRPVSRRSFRRRLATHARTHTHMHYMMLMQMRFRHARGARSRFCLYVFVYKVHTCAIVSECSWCNATLSVTLTLKFHSRAISRFFFLSNCSQPCQNHHIRTNCLHREIVHRHTHTLYAFVHFVLYSIHRLFAMQCGRWADNTECAIEVISGFRRFISLRLAHYCVLWKLCLGWIWFSTIFAWQFQFQLTEYFRSNRKMPLNQSWPFTNDIWFDWQRFEYQIGLLSIGNSASKPIDLGMGLRQCEFIDRHWWPRRVHANSQCPDDNRREIAERNGKFIKSDDKSPIASIQKKSQKQIWIAFPLYFSSPKIFPNSKSEIN